MTESKPSLATRERSVCNPPCLSMYFMNLDSLHFHTTSKYLLFIKVRELRVFITAVHQLALAE